MCDQQGDEYAGRNELPAQEPPSRQNGEVIAGQVKQPERDNQDEKNDQNTPAIDRFYQVKHV